MVKRCAVDGKEVLMPFRCSYCGEYFCAEHRLPEKHGCPGLFAAASPYEKEKRHAKTGEVEEYWRHVGWEVPRARRNILNSEITHLIVGTLLVVLVGFSLIRYNLGLPLWILAAFVSGFAASFLLHELGHRSYARSYGLYARFRLDTFGALLTLISAIPLMPFKIIAPGAVVVSGIISIEVLGMAALIGPVINLILSAILNVAAFIVGQLPGPAVQSYLLQYLFYRLGALNAFIAFFNLIPFGALDGRKVLAWSPAKWAIAFATSLIMLILAFITW